VFSKIFEAFKLVSKEEQKRLEEEAQQMIIPGEKIKLNYLILSSKLNSR